MVKPFIFSMMKSILVVFFLGLFFGAPLHAACDDAPLRVLSLKDSLINQIIDPEFILKTISDHVQETVLIQKQEIKDKTLLENTDFHARVDSAARHVVQRCKNQGIRNQAEFYGKTYSEDELKIIAAVETISRAERQRPLSDNEKQIMQDFYQSPLSITDESNREPLSRATYDFIGMMDKDIAVLVKKAAEEAYRQ